MPKLTFLGVAAGTVAVFIATSSASVFATPESSQWAYCGLKQKGAFYWAAPQIWRMDSPGYTTNEAATAAFLAHINKAANEFEDTHLQCARGASKEEVLEMVAVRKRIYWNEERHIHTDFMIPQNVANKTPAPADLKATADTKKPPALEITKDDSGEKFRKEVENNLKRDVAKWKAEAKAATDKGKAEQARRDAQFEKDKAAAASRPGTATKQ